MLTELKKKREELELNIYKLIKAFEIENKLIEKGITFEDIEFKKCKMANNEKYLSVYGVKINLKI